MCFRLVRPKGARSLVTPAWSKGADGPAVGRAVHGKLQSVELAGDGSDVAAVVARSASQKECRRTRVLVEVLVRNALAHQLVRSAAVRRHWREMHVGIPDDGGQALEGIIDLLDEDGSLVIVDYKTDQVPEVALAARTAFYKPQLDGVSTDG